MWILSPIDVDMHALICPSQDAASRMHRHSNIDTTGSGPCALPFVRTVNIALLFRRKINYGFARQYLSNKVVCYRYQAIRVDQERLCVVGSDFPVAIILHGHHGRPSVRRCPGTEPRDNAHRPAIQSTFKV